MTGLPSLSTSQGDSHAAAHVADQALLRTLLEPLRAEVLRSWREDLHAPELSAPTGAVETWGEALFTGILLGRLPSDVLGEWSRHAAASGTIASAWVPTVGALLDAPLALLLTPSTRPADLSAILRACGAIRAAALADAQLSFSRDVETGAISGGRKGGARGDLPAHLLRRILGLSASVGPDTRLDAFSQRLAQIVCEIGGLPFAVIYFFDTADEAFYAEAMHGLAPEDWQEILASGVPRRVYDRVTISASDSGPIYDLCRDDPLLDDPEVHACFAPLSGGGSLRGEVPPPLVAQDGSSGSHRCLYLIPLDAPGRGTIGFCAAAHREDGRRLGTPARRALQALAGQGAIFIENIHLYRRQHEEAAVSSALLQVAGAVGTTDIDLLVQRTLGILPSLFGGQFAALLYLDRKRSELRMLEPKAPDGQLTALTEVLVSPAKLEQLEPVLCGDAPAAIEDVEVGHLLPVQLVQTRGLRSALIIPLDLATRPADALVVFWTKGPHRFRTRDLDVARGVRELVGVALASAQLFTDASNRAEQLSSLYRTGQMMSSSLDLDATLRTITAAAVQLTRSRLCVIYLIDPKSGLLDYVAGTGLDPATAAARSSLRPGEGLLGRCALLGKPLLIDDLRTDSSAPSLEPALTGDVRAALFLPLIASGEVIGVLGTAADTPGYFLSEHQQILQAFANQAAVAIERARLYDAAQRRREFAELQQSITQALGSTLELRDVLRQVLQFAAMPAGYDLASVHVFHGSNVDLAVVRQASGELTESGFHSPYILHEPLYAQMRETGSPVVVSDTAREPLWHTLPIMPDAASWIGAPLLLDGDYAVVLDLFSRQAGAYAQEDADTIGQFAHQVAFAVRNARIYAREREAKTRLEELDQLRADFVSTVSHELRTPLTGIKGFTETLLTYWNRLDDERRHHYLDRIYGASKRLQRLVQDLLFVSKVEGGNLPLTVRRVKLEDMLEPAILEVKQKYRGQVIRTEAPEDLPIVLADVDRAQQVLVNLMDNGVKYSPEGSEIVVHCTVLPDAVKLAVEDHGPGIQPQDMPRLFTRFGKIDQVIRAGHVGTGLGLFISKQLVEQMNGEISVESVVGQGSIFSFTLPRADT